MGLREAQRIFHAEFDSGTPGSQKWVKISIISKKKDYSVQAENYRRMLLTLHNDIRVILIKIADRLHNMRTVEYLNDIKREKIASESLYIYAPLAHRVGLFNLKNEIEDLSLRTINPKVYNSIKNKFDKSQESQEKYIESFKKLIIKSLDNQDASNFYTGTESTTVNTSNWTDYESLEGGDPKVLYQGNIDRRTRKGKRRVFSRGVQINNANIRIKKNKS